MFSLGKVFSAPTVKVDQKERKVEYHPRTYSQFIRGLRDKELPSVIVRPNKNIALFQEENGDYGDVQIADNEQLWQTLMESDAEVLVDNSQPVSLMENVILFFFIAYIFKLVKCLFFKKVTFRGTVLLIWLYINI